MPGNDVLERPEQDYAGDDRSEVVFIEPVRIGLPGLGDVVREVQEVLLRAFAHYVGQLPPGVLSFGQVRLRKDLTARIGLLEAFLSARRHSSCFVHVLAASALVEPVRLVLRARSRWSPDTAGDLLDSAVELVVREEVSVAHAILAVGVSRDLRDDLPGPFRTDHGELHRDEHVLQRSFVAPGGGE